ncbi:hypothetical protein KBA73_00800 [Patescibacteria group bacterium]|nr:hypothetical protein [Patescibacteria group bacterium]
MDLILYLEDIMRVDGTKSHPTKKADAFIASIENIDVTEITHLESFLDAVMPELVLERQDRNSAGHTLVASLKRRGAKNLHFPEQLYALLKWNCIDETTKNLFLSNWTDLCIEEQGLTFDPGKTRLFTEDESASGMTALHDQLMSRVAKTEAKVRTEPVTPAQIFQATADKFASIYYEEGLSERCKAVLKDAPLLTAEKFQLLKNCLHYGLFSLHRVKRNVPIYQPSFDDVYGMYGEHDGFYDTPSPEDGFRTDPEEEGLVKKGDRGVQLYFQWIQELPFTDEQREELIQELHIAHFYKEGILLDPVHKVPRMDPSHPLVYAWRLDRTKTSTFEPPRFKSFMDWMASRTGLSPVELPFAEWPEEEQERFILPSGDVKMRTVFQGQLESFAVPNKQKAKNLLDKFKCLRPKQFGLIGREDVMNGLIFAWENIPEWCATIPGFQEGYDRCVALRCADLYSFEESRDKTIAAHPCTSPERWSTGTYTAVLRLHIEQGNWEHVQSWREDFPRYAEVFERNAGAYCADILLRLIRRKGQPPTGDRQWMKDLLRGRPAFLSDILKKHPEVNEYYQQTIASEYQSSFYEEFEGSFLQIPGLDQSHPAIQEAVAKRTLTVLCSPIYGPDESMQLLPSDPRYVAILSQDLKDRAPGFEFVEWKRPEVRRATTEEMLEIISERKKWVEVQDDPDALHEGGGGFSTSGYLKRIERLEQMTGYKVTDAFYVWEQLAKDQWRSDEGDAFRSLRDWLDEWKLLHELLGRPFEEDRFKDALSARLDLWCAADVITLEDIRKFEKKYSVRPSTQAICERIASQLNDYGRITDGLELVHQLGVVMEMTTEDLAKLQNLSPRAEAIIYATMLPKKGKERLEAERAFRTRSPLADLIPDLLAIQSPSKREEFCPYSQGLGPLLKSEFPFELEQARVRKGLLTFFRRFGMRNLPLLAQSVIELVAKSEDGKTLIQTNDPALSTLNQFLDVQEEQLSLEEYFARIEAITTAMRRDLLEDRPLDARIERSVIGMELFNTVVPHVGTYQQVDDRPTIIADTRLHAEQLVLDPIYAPAAFPIEIALEQTIEEDLAYSPIDFAKRKQREVIERKYQDETMQKFLQGWNRAMLLVELEPTGGSRAFWFQAVKDRWQALKGEREKQFEQTDKLQARLNITKKIEELTQALQRVGALLQPENVSREATPAPTAAILLEELQSLFVTPAGKIDRVKLEAEAGDIARALCIVLMREHSPEHYRAVTEAYWTRPVDVQCSHAQVDAWERWFREEYLQHFAQLKSEAQVSLTPSTHALFQKLWRIDGVQAAIQARLEEPNTSPIGHPIMDPFSLIRHAEKELRNLDQHGLQVEQQQLMFWPAKGLGRALSGDIANACFHSHRADLARGHYPNLTALLMTLPGRTEIAGSTLLIDANTASGKRVLVIRALNPTESIVRELDAAALVEATIKYARQVVDEQVGRLGAPFEEIRLCFDHAGGHSTNRQEIATAEHTLANAKGWVCGESLEETPETSFNHYDVWRSRETLVVWKRSGT